MRTCEARDEDAIREDATCRRWPTHAVYGDHRTAQLCKRHAELWDRDREESDPEAEPLPCGGLP